ncbi:type II/IV secretion system protein, partial [Listeria monocytogenes]|nr:type II/IV secretion system protein [Listeria monocytogenes]
CTHLRRKRTAIYEVLTQQEIKAYFQSNQQQIEPKYPIKRTFEKGVSYGFFSAY